MPDGTAPARVRVLLVEDDDGDAELITAEVAAQIRPRVDVARVPTLAAGVHALRTADYDAVLLDLTLPDSDHLETIDRVRRVAPGVPVVVLTGLQDDGLARDALRRGAQDYLTKGDPTPAPVWRSVQYAIERQRLLNRVTALQAEADHLHEMRALERLQGAGSPMRRASDLLEGNPLRDEAPDVFAAAVRRYAAHIDRAWRDRAFDAPEPQERVLTDLAADLGRAGAAPRDIVDVHRTALEREPDGLAPGGAKARREESRWALLRLMGELADHYRRRGLVPGAMPAADGDGGRARGAGAHR
ncbi:MAG TPA: response regulator [Miltoncostaeaceae bacterium]|nr:response regulator [Miltoncostaeaceae bacterium]